ncbi:MAG: nucleotidyl transferase AbiEii/AbiGii toxin family protein [Chlorobiales bacterium]|nr:nucleotidyl transferase AbiEii/AbiGii toxin family protein [Chlorobiales bacterium]
MDLGFGDRVYPDPSRHILPSLLDFPEAKLYCYSRESVIAEKFEAMIKLGTLNSRMKDFYDIWMLSRQYDFQGDSLCEAMRQTLEQRGTELVMPVAVFSSDFIAAKQVQWKAFRKRLRNEYDVPDKFDEVVQQLQVFLAPVMEAISAKKRFVDIWMAPDSGQKSHERPEKCT